MKIARYNGQTDFYYGSFSNPAILKTGTLYEVTCIKEYAYHTEYTLSDVPGKFNSSWFDLVGESCDTRKTTFIPYHF